MTYKTDPILVALILASLGLGPMTALAETTEDTQTEDTQTDVVEDSAQDIEVLEVQIVQSPVDSEPAVAVEDKLVSVFENGTTEIQYGYVEHLDDGRGFTAGRAGFTSATGDLLQVVEEYSAQNPDAALTAFLPALRAVNGSDSVAGLDGFAEAWSSSASDPALIAAQDKVNDELYRQPARDLARQIGATMPLSHAAIYEAGIQHGYGDDADSVNAIAQRASDMVGGSPASGVDEKTWLHAFLEERRADLLAPANSETADVWKASVGRADAMLGLFDAGNFNLDGKIQISVFGDSYSF